jgi:hypothetical protein
MKLSYVAVALVLVSVVGVVALSGVPETSKVLKPRASATVVEPTSAVELPPFPPLEGPLWELSHVDARLRIPNGWSLSQHGSNVRLVRNSADLLDGNMNLVLMPNIYGFSVEELMRENTDELAVNPDLTLEDRREMYVLGRKVLRFDYHGTPRGGSERVRFIAVVWTRGKYQLVLTTTIRDALWPEHAVAIEAALESLQIRWPIPRAN